MRRPNLPLALLLASACILPSQASAAFSDVEEAVLVPTLPPDSDLGYSVAIHGNRAVVGAPRGMGSVYVLVRSQSGEWVLETKLVPEDGDAGWTFGHSVDIFGEWIVVGAPGDGGFAGEGAAYTFKFDSTSHSWEPRTKIVPPAHPTQTHETFGRVVSITADQLAVSDPRMDASSTAQLGCVRVYRLTGESWTLANSLYTGLPESAQFGTSLDLSGDRIAIGAPFLGGGEVFVFAKSSQTQSFVLEDRLVSPALQHNGMFVNLSGDFLLVGGPDTNNQRGMVALWERVGGAWVEQQLIPGAVDGERFGSRVALRPLTGGGVQALISAPRSDLQVNDGGRVSVYEGDGAGLTEVAPLFASASESGERLGTSLALGDGFALCGAYGRDSIHAFEHNGSAWSHTQRYLGTDHNPNENFGNAVALRGDVAIVGAHEDDDSAYDAGTAHIFQRIAGEWHHMERLDAGNNVQRLAGYGSAVGMAENGEIVIVGAPDEDTRGAVYIHRGAGSIWTAPSRETAPDTTIGSRFGTAVAVEADVAVVGAPNANGGANQSGAVYVFRPGFLGHWNHEQKLFDLGGQSLDEFGASVAITADGEILVGAPGKSVTGADSGQVFRFAFNGTSWNLVDVLAPPSVAAGEGFGQALSTVADRLAVGAPLAAIGRVFLFSESGGSWVHDETLSGEFGYGRSVGIDGELLGVSSIDRAWALQEGPGGWSSQELLPSTGPIQGFQLTTPVAVSAGAILVGADGDTLGGTLSGAAYVFRPDVVSGGAFCFGDGTGLACPCGANGNAGAGCENTGGTGGAILTANGNASFATDTLQLIVSGIPGAKAGLCVKGSTQLGGGLGSPAGDGLLCTGPQLRSQVILSDVGGTLCMTDWNGQPFGSFPGAANVGTPTYYQWWYRDPGNACPGDDFNFTNGWCVNWLP